MPQLLKFVRQISAAQFAAIVLLFFLPFVEVSCSNMLTIDVTGQQMATGGKVDLPPNANFNVTPNTQAAAPGQSQNGNVDQQPSALIAWILAVIGIGVSLMAGRTYRMAAAAAGFLGAVCLLWLKSAVEGNFLSGMPPDQVAQVRNFVRLDFLFAFWLCLILFLTATATNVYALMKEAPPPKP
jgi:hypothetical protein